MFVLKMMIYNSLHSDFDIALTVLLGRNSFCLGHCPIQSCPLSLSLSLV